MYCCEIYSSKNEDIYGHENSRQTELRSVYVVQFQFLGIIKFDLSKIFSIVRYWHLGCVLLLFQLTSLVFRVHTFQTAKLCVFLLKKSIWKLF